MGIRSVGCFLVGVGITLCSAASDAVVLENSHVRMVFATKPVPALRALVHMPSGTDLLAGPTEGALFALQITLSNGVNATVESGQAKQGTVTVTPVGGGQQVRLTFEGLGASGDVRVVLDGRLDDAEPFVRWQAAVENPSRLRLTSLRFPSVDAVPAIGSPDDDFIIVPSSPGSLIENPAKNWTDGYSVSWKSPGDQSVQFCSYQDRTAGVYVASMDKAGHERVLQVYRQKGRYRLSHGYAFAEEAAAEWKSPYDVAFGVTSGTWQQTADIYKRWAVRQPWCAKTLRHRDEIPAFWKQGFCLHTCEVRTYDGSTQLCNGSYYPKLEEHLRLLREKIGGPVVPLLTGWENHRRWTAGEYFPVFDQAHAKGVLARIRQDGFRPFVYLSGLFYTYWNEGRDGGELTSWQSYTNLFVIDPATGTFKTYVLNESVPNTENVWKRHSYQFCPAAPGVKTFFRTVIDQAHALGVDIIQMDQAALGYWTADPCGSPSHGHPPGSGPYQTQAFRDLLDDMRSYGKSLSPEFVLTVEELNEMAIPHVDGFHTREYRERWWYHGARGARSLPLFTYLYHEYALVYGGEGPSASATKNPLTVRNMAVNLVTGKTPAVSVWMNQKAMAEAHADQIRMLSNHMTLLQTEAQQFLMLGRMLHSLEFDVPTVTFQIPVQREGKWVNEPFVERAVLTSSWQSPEGGIGHCLVNIADTNQTVLLQLDTRNAPAWAKADVALYRAGSAESRPLVRGVALPLSYTLELEPLEAAFFVLRLVK